MTVVEKLRTSVFISCLANSCKINYLTDKVCFLQTDSYSPLHLQRVQSLHRPAGPLPTAWRPETHPRRSWSLDGQRQQYSAHTLHSFLFHSEVMWMYQHTNLQTAAKQSHFVNLPYFLEGLCAGMMKKMRPSSRATVASVMWSK